MNMWQRVKHRWYDIDVIFKNEYDILKEKGWATLTEHWDRLICCLVHGSVTGYVTYYLK